MKPSSAVARRLDPEELRSAIAAWAYIAGFGGRLPQALGAALPWLRSLWSVGLDHVPLDVVLDLGHLLLHGRHFPFASSARQGEWASEEIAWRLTYEDEVLGRWALDPAVAEVQALLTKRTEAARQETIVHALSLAFGGEPSDPGAFAGNPAYLKPLGAAFTDEVAAAVGADPPAVSLDWVEWARDQRASVLARVRPRLFSPLDLWELTHIDRLPSASTRLALRQLRNLADGVEPLRPGWGAELRRRSRQIATDEVTDDDFPAGGFEALSRRGRFENLVRSEMGYIGEGVAGPDLFDVRFAQGELMYYTRDESPLFDRRVVWTAVFDRAAELRRKHPGVPAQTLVLAQAVALRVHADLLEVMGPAGAETTYAWADALDVGHEEAGLFGLTLADEIALNRVVLEPDAPAVTADAPNRSHAPRVTFSNLAAPARRPAVDLWIRVGEPVWTVGSDPVDLRAPGALRKVVDIVLAHLLLR